MTSPSLTSHTPVPLLPSVRFASSRAQLAGRVLSGLCIAFLSADAIAKIMQVRAVVEGTMQIGYPASAVLPIGLILLGCVALYTIPATSVLGAVLLTGYLGGAIATHVRVQNPLFSHILFPTYVAAMAWGGLFLRDPRLRQFLPLRR